MIDQQNLEKLLGLFACGKTSREEYGELMDHVRSGTAEQDLEHATDHVFRKIKKFWHLSAEDKEEIYQNIILDGRFKSDLSYENSKILRLWQCAVIATSILLLLSTALYFYNRKSLFKGVRSGML